MTSIFASRGASCWGLRERLKIAIPPSPTITLKHTYIYTHTAPSQNTHILFETFRGAWKDHVKVNYDIIMFYISGSGEGEGPRPPIVLASGPTMGCEDLFFCCCCLSDNFSATPYRDGEGATSNGK